MDKNIRVAETAGEMTLSEATKPLLLLSRLLGMNPKSQLHKTYTCCILTIELLTLFWVWKYRITRNAHLENYYFQLFVHIFPDSLSITSFLVILGLGLTHQKRFMIPVKDFVNVDASLKGLGGLIDNKSIYRFQSLLLTYVVLISSFFGLVEFAISELRLSSSKAHVISLMCGFYVWIILIVNGVADCSFSTSLLIIRKRFQEINIIIRRSANRRHLRVDFIEVGSDNDVLKELKILRVEYHNLWRIVNRVNDAYGPHLVAGLTTSFALITSKLWKSYYVLTKHNEHGFGFFVGGVGWVLFYMTRMLILVEPSESTVAEAKTTSVVLQELEMNGNHDHVTKNEIRDFLMQLQSEVRNFSACGFFDIDFKLISGIIGAACTYLVILIQMGDSTGCVMTSGHANETHPIR